jgi:hypothetical protein
VICVSNMNNRILWWLVGLLLISVAAAALYKVMPLLDPPLAAVAPLDPACDLRSAPCVSALPGGGQVELEVQPRRIPVVRPLRLTVRVRGLEARRVEVDFTGVDMNMGYNRPELRRVEHGHFAGTAMLPVCVRARMTWEARVLLHTADGLLAAPFRFDTFQPGVPAPASNGAHNG